MYQCLEIVDYCGNPGRVDFKIFFLQRLVAVTEVIDYTDISVIEFDRYVQSVVEIFVILHGERLDFFRRAVTHKSHKVNEMTDFAHHATSAYVWV